MGKSRTLFAKCILMLLAIHLIVMAMVFDNTIKVKANGDGVRRMINVVYDDSGSMVIGHGEMIPRWSQAKYAMEVFGALMGYDDIMNIYPMSTPGKIGLSVNGSDAKRVDLIHDMNGAYRDTPSKTITRAADDLLAADSSYEKWLVIFTDGDFDDDEKPEKIRQIQDMIDAYNDEGIKTIYLAIGETAKVLQSKPSQGGFADKAADGEEVLNKITSMANQIFQHLILGDNHIDIQGNVNTLHIDIPIETIIVFAQGDNVEIGNMIQNGKEITPSTLQNVKHSDVIPTNYPNAKTDTSLKGVVATYNAGNTPFKAGDYQISVSNANTIQYYYTPGVELNCALMYRGNPVSGKERLYAGEYDIRMNFIDPLSGDEVSSDLLKVNEYQLTLVNNGQEQQVASEQEHIHIEEGDITLRALATMPGNVNLTSIKNYTVYPEPIELKISVEGNAPSYTPDQTGIGAVPVVLSITDSSGSELSASQKKATKLEIETKNQIKWNVLYNERIGKWEARPEFTGDSISDAVIGETQFNVSASFDVDKQTAFGSAILMMTMNPYEGSALEVQIEDPAGPYEMKTLKDSPAMMVMLHTLDPVTNEEGDISEELWNALSLSTEGDGVDWSVEKTETPGEAMLTAGYLHGEPLATKSGEVQVTVRAHGALGEYSYSGSDSRVISILPLSMEDIIKHIAKRVLQIGIVLWIVIGYLRKKRLRLRGLNPRCHYMRKESSKRRISKNIWTVILPYLDERAVVKCRSSGYQCNFPDLKIIATGSRSFRILNKSIDLKNTLINGDRFDDMKVLRKRSFGMGSFDITSLDRKTGKRLGTFTFN